MNHGLNTTLHPYTPTRIYTNTCTRTHTHTHTIGGNSLQSRPQWLVGRRRQWGRSNCHTVPQLEIAVTQHVTVTPMRAQARRLHHIAECSLLPGPDGSHCSPQTSQARCSVVVAKESGLGSFGAACVRLLLRRLASLCVLLCGCVVDPCTNQCANVYTLSRAETWRRAQTRALAHTHRQPTQTRNMGAKTHAETHTHTHTQKPQPPPRSLAPPL